MTRVKTREKISATVDRDLLRQAREVTGLASVSELLDHALAASITAEKESRWHAGYKAQPAGEEFGDVRFDDLGLD